MHGVGRSGGFAAGGGPDQPRFGTVEATRVASRVQGVFTATAFGGIRGRRCFKEGSTGLCVPAGAGKRAKNTGTGPQWGKKKNEHGQGGRQEG